MHELPTTALAAALAATVSLAPLPAHAERFVDDWVSAHIDDLVADYQGIHSRPELSGEERATAAYVAAALEGAGYEVHTGIGGHGVAGVLRVGDGPTLLIRGDMDALPVTEETQLPYASAVPGVMHACGHDVHTVALAATARVMAAGARRWAGTLVAIAQPAEEIGAGARRMIADGLFDVVPRPDYTLALHVSGTLRAGDVGLTPGWAFANVDSVDIVLHGVGGHGARPHQAVDPIVASAAFIMAVQTLVSRRIDPLDPAVVTVGSIRAGTKHNVIPERSHLQLTVRSYSDDVRERLLEGIAQLAEDTCRQFRCPRPPEIEVREHHTPSVYNDPALVERARGVFAALLGDARVVEQRPAMVGEDFGRYSRVLGVPGLLFRVGSVEPARFAAAAEPGAPPLPTLHSGRYAPDARATLETAVRSMSALALDLLAAREAGALD